MGAKTQRHCETHWAMCLGKGRGKGGKPKVDGGLSAGEWARSCNTVAKPTGGWFSFVDCLTRYSLTVMLFYWSLLTSPRSFVRYTYEYNKLWYGTLGLVLTLMLPVLPFAIVVLELGKKVKGLFSGPDWMMAGPGRVFFVKPANPVADLLWSSYLTNSMYVGQFLLTGTHPDAISHTWVDSILTKDFWRSALNEVGARVPREMGRWTGTTLELAHQIDKTDLVIKVPDSYLGIGDSFWNFGKDYSTEADLRKLLQQTYPDKEVMVLELVRPKQSLGVHSLDIITVRTPDEDVKVLSVLLWTNCTTDSSHSCQEGYVVDPESGTILSAASWYCAAFAEMPTPLLGRQFPGVREACEKAVAAHKIIEHKWLVAVGWDAMVQEGDQVVFFEGNFAGARTPRRMFLSLTSMVSSVRDFFWPFGSGNSAQPQVQ